MVHRFRWLLLVAMSAMGMTATAQQQTNDWTLQRCVQYALDHNLSIRQNVLNERLSRLTLQQSRLAQLPNANLNSGYGRSFGRSINPTTNQFIDGSYDFISLNGNADVLLFGWFRLRNTAAANGLFAKAAGADVEQLRDDVSLNVATGFLRAVLAKEQIRVNEKQVELSKAQLEQTRKFVTSGRLPELNNAQLESQLATDSSNLITAISDYNASILDLKALLNLDFAVPFDVHPPDVSMQEQIALTSMSPEEVYTKAYDQFGSIKSSRYKVEAATKNYLAAKGTLYPSLGMGAQVATNWTNNSQTVAGFTQGNSLVPTGYYSDTLGSSPIYSYPTSPIYRNIPFGNQFRNNFRQTVSLNLSIPLFNGWQSQYNVRQAQINVETQRINQYQTELTLKQNVYKAYNDARNSIQKYYAAQRAADAANRAYDFAQKRYNLGLTNTVEYLTTQNNQYSADVNLQSAKYDLIFRLKVIDYYIGKDLKL